MGDRTAIEWTDATWNPIRARNLETGGVGHFCVHSSPGCRHCYAERLQKRFRNPVRYARQDAAKVEIFLDTTVLERPLRWRKPRRVFTCSMTDLFLREIGDQHIDTVFAVMGLAHRHRFQVLTKRSDRMRQYFADPDTALRIANAATIAGRDFDTLRHADPPHFAALALLPFANVDIGVSAEDQAWLDLRMAGLRGTPAARRLLSLEPLLGPVDLRYHLPFLDWVIAGGESGPNARPMDPDWARAVRDSCNAAGVPFFFKQWGGRTPKAGGRLLDGRVWDELPDA